MLTKKEKYQNQITLSILIRSCNSNWWWGVVICLGNHCHNRYPPLVSDAYSKKIVSYDLSEGLASEDAVRAVRWLFKSYTTAELIHHPNRGI